jgi:hypothetical protein
MRKYVSPTIHNYGNLSALIQALPRGPKDFVGHGNLI